MPKAVVVLHIKSPNQSSRTVAREFELPIIVTQPGTLYTVGGISFFLERTMVSEKEVELHAVDMGGDDEQFQSVLKMLRDNGWNVPSSG